MNVCVCVCIYVGYDIHTNIPSNSKKVQVTLMCYIHYIPGSPPLCSLVTGSCELFWYVEVS